MLKTLAQTACSLLLVGTVLFAKEVPIVKQIEIKLPYKEFSVIEFPFEIKAHDFTPFVSKVYIDTKQSTPKDDFAVPKMKGQAEQLNKKPAPKKITTIKKSNPMDVGAGKNFIKIYPRKTGSTELLIWGYKDYPIMLKIEIVDSNEADKYIKFIDYDRKTDLAEKYESAPHDRIIINLTKALYNNNVPSGYTLSTNKREVFGSGLKLVLTKQIDGKLYTGQEYMIENTSNKNTVLDTSMFRGQDGIYSITFSNDFIKPSEKTRMFVVKQRVRDEQ